jgi:predicted amino acid dehydrogenase
VKQIISISLGTSKDDYEFVAEFLGQDFNIKRIGTDGDVDLAANLLEEWDSEADAISLGGLNFNYAIGSSRAIAKQQKKVEDLKARIKSPVTTGEKLRRVSFEWAIRHLQFSFGNNYFNHTKVLSLSGMLNYNIVKVIAEYTDNITFADPLFENGIPKFLNSLNDLEMYAKGVHDVLEWVPSKRLASSAMPVRQWNDYIRKKAIQKANIIVVPSYDFYDYLEGCGLEELGGKTIITATVYEDRIQFLQERGVDVVIDCTPKILEQVVGFNVLESMISAALEIPLDEVSEDDLLEVISEQHMDPRVIYPQGEFKRVNRFAFVIHPLSQEQLKKDPKIQLASRYAPKGFMDAVEKIIAYSPPFIYSKVTGIKSPTGVETEGWLITVGGTPKQMLAHSAEFTYKRLLQAAKMAKRLGAQIMGLGAFTKVVGDAGKTVAKLADIPITTGNSYSASGALWAAADAGRRMGLLEIEKGKKLKGNAMVVGATGAIGSVCCRLLAMAFTDVYMVDVRHSKLLALKESILDETPETNVEISTRADKFLADMDVIVTATSAGGGKSVIDIMKVKPGCIITDVARPLDLSAEDVAKRPDVLVIESGEILLPGDNVEMKDIGLPPRVAYACLAETIVLALEGRYEIFTIGREIEWQKVKEIYKLGIKHGMKLAAISGVNGVYSDADIAEVARLAREARKLDQPKKKSTPKKKRSAS